MAFFCCGEGGTKFEVELLLLWGVIRALAVPLLEREEVRRKGGGRERERSLGRC
jgi:hypothetical protein